VKLNKDSAYGKESNRNIKDRNRCHIHPVHQDGKITENRSVYYQAGNSEQRSYQGYFRRKISELPFLYLKRLSSLKESFFYNSKQGF